MPKRHFLMLAHNYKKQHVAGWYLSEKLDGMRAFWDGGASRGMPKAEVAWANTGKDERYVTPPMATGLWSRYGNVIHAPDWWLDSLPAIPLDGELYAGFGFRQDLMRVVKKIEPGDWSKVKFHCFDMPSYDTVFADGHIDIVNQNCVFQNINVIALLDYQPKKETPFRSTYTLLKRHLEDNKIAVAHPQHKLPMQSFMANIEINAWLDKVTDRGGEGLMLRDPNSCWEAHRSHSLLKVKKLHDMEGTVIGYTTGRETDKGSKLLGLMGAMILELPNGKILELSGFTDEERSLEPSEAVGWAVANPGEKLPVHFQAKHFPRGSKVTFRYRDLTKDGIPQEARYWRKKV